MDKSHVNFWRLRSAFPRTLPFYMLSIIASFILGENFPGLDNQLYSYLNYKQ